MRVLQLGGGSQRVWDDCKRRFQNLSEGAEAEKNHHGQGVALGYSPKEVGRLEYLGSGNMT